MRRTLEPDCQDSRAEIIPEGVKIQALGIAGANDGGAEAALLA